MEALGFRVEGLGFLLVVISVVFRVDTGEAEIVAPPGMARA